MTESTESEEWWVVDQEGELLGRFEKPLSMDQSIEAIANGKIYMRERDEMGETSIVRYRIEFQAVVL